MFYSRPYIPGIPNIYSPRKLIEWPNTNKMIVESNEDATIIPKNNYISVSDFNIFKNEIIIVKEQIVNNIDNGMDEIKKMYLDIDKKLIDIKNSYTSLMQEIMYRNSILYYNELIITCILIIVVILLIFK